jgi:hypothetical protein
MKSRPKRTRNEALDRELVKRDVTQVDDDTFVQPDTYASSTTPRKLGWFFIIIGTMVLAGLVLGITAGGLEWIAVVVMTAFLVLMYFMGFKIISAPNTTAAELEAAEREQEGRDDQEVS